ncbi:MAG TPA: TonB-dependent receptor [Blastocatellia bacterium]|nr:TonB-dependent receptor [Blastocatellia bacterium]
MSKKSIFVALCLNLLLVTFGSRAAARQVSSASLLGEARDEASSVLSGVKVTARHEATGFSRSVLSDSEGAYRINDLLPGLYTVSAEKAGFRVLTINSVVLEVNQKGRLDLRLTVGQMVEAVTVTASVSPLQTEDSSVGYRLDFATIGDLPLAGRNIVSLLTLGPGAVPRQLGGFGHDIINDVQESRGAVALNPPINGARSTMNSFLLDGAMNTDLNTRSIAVVPPLETVQEFRVISSLPSAEFVQSGGGVADIVTKSGGRAFHGSLFEFFRNEAFDARTLFDDTSLPRPIFRQNQFGASLGGPLPFASTFFFANYEALRGKTASATLGVVPDERLRRGDFRGRATIHDPRVTDIVTGKRVPFPNNIIPAHLLDPIALMFLEKYQPLPNRPGQDSNYLDSTPSRFVKDNASVRVDHELRDRSRVFGRYTINDERNRLASAFPQRPTNERVRAQQLALGHTLTGIRWLNESRISFTRLGILELPESAFRTNDAAELGITGVALEEEDFGLPFFLVGNFSLPFDTPNRPQTQRDNLFYLSDTVSFIGGPHTWKFGFQYMHFQLNYLQSQLSRGRFIYSGAFTSDPTSPTPTGDPFADFLLGFPQVTERSVGRAQAYFRQNTYAVFVQDDWRVSNRLTLNYGLRYEYFSPFREKRGNMFNLDFSQTPAPPRLVRTERAVEPDRNNFAPRVGLAWRPPVGFLKDDFVVRAGYGVYFNPEIATENYDLVRNGIVNETNASDGSRLPILTTRDGFPRTPSTGFPSFFGIDPGARTPYVQHWTLSLQYQLPFKVLFESAYVGSKGSKLGKSRTFNTPLHTETGENLAPRPGDLQSLRTWPELGELIQRQHISNSSFHSLQLKAEKRLSSRLAFLGSFVWSKSIDDGDTVLNGLFDSVTAQDERNLALERGLSFFDVRRRLSVGLTYMVPGPDFLHGVFDNWQVSAILTEQDGTPLNPVYFFSDFANTGTPNRPDVVPGVSITLPRGERTVERWFNPAAFRDPAPFTFGNAGRNIIPGPGNNLLDFALHRRFPFGEGRTLEFRVESFNVFNHPNYGIPLPFPDFGPFFGRIVSTGEPRRIQFGLRFDF